MSFFWWLFHNSFSHTHIQPTDKFYWLYLVFSISYHHHYDQPSPNWHHLQTTRKNFLLFLPASTLSPLWSISLHRSQGPARSFENGSKTMLLLCPKPSSGSPSHKIQSSHRDLQGPTWSVPIPKPLISFPVTVSLIHPALTSSSTLVFVFPVLST